MPDGEENKNNHAPWMTIFKNLLGGGILCWMMYFHISIKPIDPIWLFIFPGLLLEIDVKSYFSGFFKK